MKKVIYLFSLVVFFAACDSAEISPKSKSYIYNSDKVVIGLFEDEQIIIPLLNQIIGSEINFQAKRALVKKAEVVGVRDEYKYLITELEFLDIINQDGMKSIKVASILFGEDDLYRYDEMMASGEQHTCNGESDNVLLYCSCCSFKYDEEDKSKIIGCSCCQFGRCAHTVTTGNEPPGIGGRTTPTLMELIGPKLKL
ncbi:hypothetical protein [Algoriphagus namhaensis]